MRLLHFLSLCCCILAVSCEKQTQPADVPNSEMTVNLKRDAIACSTALRAGDYEGLLRYAPAKLTKMVGGVAALRKGIEAALKPKDGSKLEILDVDIDEPGPIKKDGERLLSLVPQRIVIQVTGGLVMTNGWLLGISEDAGRNWLFIDTARMRDDR